MRWSEMSTSFPATKGEAREARILRAVTDGHYVPPIWWPLHVTFRGHTGTVFVAQDALQLGEPGDCIRVNVTPATAQRIADQLGCILPTTKLLDDCYRQATAKAEPQLQPSDGIKRVASGYSPSMDDTAAMLRHDRAVTDALSKQQGLVCNVGKHWVLSNRLLQQSTTDPLGTACNYGWFTKTAPYRTASGLLAWQTLGAAHNRAHVDYSQVVQLVQQSMVVDGVTRSIFEVGADPELAGIISDEGVLRVWRQPGVPLPGTTDVHVVTPVAPGTVLAFTRTLLLGAQGEDVKQWQGFLKVLGSGVFDAATDGATRQFQHSHADPQTGKPLLVDGKVGPATVRAANADLVAAQHRVDAGTAALITSQVHARNFTNVDRSKDIQLVVLHTAECDEVLTAAEALGAWVSGPNAPSASWHFAVDADSTVQCLPEELIAWQAPGANRTGIGIELAGRAKQSNLEWRDPFSTATLERAAALVAYLCQKWHLPTTFVDAAGLVRGERGVTTHWEVTKAFHKSTHVDPGPHFPMDWLLGRVRAIQGGIGT